MESDLVKVYVFLAFMFFSYVGIGYLSYEIGERTCMEEVDRVFFQMPVRKPIPMPGPTPSPLPSPTEVENEEEEDSQAA